MFFLSGRWPRKVYNLVLIGSSIAAYILIEVSPFFNIVIQQLGIEALWFVTIAISVLLSIGFVLISILRLHDVNRAGWWVLFGFVPFINVLFVIFLMLWPSSTQLHKFKNLMKTLAQVLLLIILAVLLLQIDDDLSSEVTEYVSLVEDRVSKGSEAYLYLNGIATLEEKNILTQGSKLLTSYNNSAENIFSEQSNAAKSESDAEKLATPDNTNKLYCPLSDSGCLNDIIDSSSNWGNEIQLFSELMKRYERFISYQEYSMLSKSDASSPLPPYHYLTFGNRVKTLSALSLAESGQAQDAIEMLLNDNQYLRKQLALADSVIHKLIFINLFSNNLDIIVYIHSAYRIDKATEIAYLSHSEMSMKYPLIREFLTNYNIYLDADQNPDGWNGLPSWMVRIIFKPNMTINDRVVGYNNMISLSNLSAKDFSKKIVNSEAVGKSEPNYRNYAGSIMIEEPITYLSKYIAKVHDLNAKISLANFILSRKTQPLENPYGDLYNKIIEKEDFICLDGPLRDKRNLRCLQKRK